MSRFGVSHGSVIKPGLPSAVRDPGFWDDYPTKINDDTPGPKTDDYPKDCVVSFNHMQNNGRTRSRSRTSAGTVRQEETLAPKMLLGDWIVERIKNPLNPA